jgi:hypothetical protein
MTNPNSFGSGTNQEPSSNDMADAWASLADNSNELFNPKPQSSPDSVDPKPQTVPDSIESKTELSSEDKEKIGRKLRKELLEAAESTSKKQYEAYGYLYESLDDSGYNALATTVGNLSEHTKRLDAGRTKALIDYIDLKFASGPGVEKSRKEARESYKKSSTAYAEVLEKSLGYAGQGLLISNETTAAYLLNLRKKLPEGQMATSTELIDYFDNPSEETKKQLEKDLTGHDNSIGEAFHFLTRSAEETMPRGSKIPESVYKLGNTTRKGHEDLYKALINYYEFKKDNYQGDTSVESQPSQVPQPKISYPQRPKSPRFMSAEELRKEIP